MNNVKYDGSLLLDAELIRSGFNLIPQAISIFDEELRLRVWNSAFTSMFNLPEEVAFKGAYLQDIFRYLAECGEYGPGDVEQQVAERLAQAEAFTPLYLERGRPDGTIVSVEGFPLGQGGWVTVYTDITAHKKHEELLEAHSDKLNESLVERSKMLEEANRKLLASNRALAELQRELAESEKRMREITQALPVHIAYLTKDYTYTFSNERFSDITGIPHPIVVGKSIPEIFGPKIFNDIEPFLKRALRGKQTVIEFDYPEEGVNKQTIRTSFTPERDEDENIKGVFLLSLNVTEEKAAIDAHIRSKRMETTVQLTTGLAHDFGNILTVILGNLKHIGSKYIEDNKRDALIKDTKNAAQRAVGIIEQLVSFAGEKTLAPKYTDISNLLTELVRLFTPSLDGNAELDLVLPESSIIAFVDESALQDVMVNLLLNAHDAIEGNGNITVTAEKLVTNEEKDAQVRITVQDNGCGFDEETKDRAFEPFFTSKQDRGGSGLGLSMALGFASQSGGDISIQSMPGEGTSVYLILPCFPLSDDKKKRDNGRVVFK